MAGNYTYDMQRLQQDAIRRAREMQSRAQISPAPVTRPVPKAPIPVQAAQPQNQSAPKPTAPVHEQHDHEPSKGLSPVNDIFEMLLSDSERTLILALILLLVEEKADMSLIFALMYLAI